MSSSATEDEQQPRNVSSETLHSGSNSNDTKSREFLRLWLFCGILVLDGIFSLTLLTPIIPGLARVQNEHVSNHYTLSGSLLDLAVLAALRLLAAAGGLLSSFLISKDTPEYPFALHHPNGERKSREELEQEALEEPWTPWLWRNLKRSASGAEFLALVTEILSVIKCLARMNAEIGIRSSQDSMHPSFWIAVLATTLFALVEANQMDAATKKASKYGQQMLQNDRESTSLLRSLSSTLSIPLLAGNDNGEPNNNEETEEVLSDERGVSDIGPDAKSRATWGDLLYLCWPDVHLIALAFIFLLCAATMQVFIPRFLGNILDALAKAFGNAADDDANRHESMMEVPGFMSNVKLLVLASVGAGVFSGLRGSLFTVVGGRTNIRLRVQLMDALFSQDIGFFDVTKTGDITSRLSSDTTLVGDQVMLNVNVFLRSLVQAMGVLLFMFMVSWQLSIIAFISVPLISILSKWYGNYVRSLTKLMQKRLAEGNSVSEAALGSMTTVRAFDAAEGELREFEVCMENYLHLNQRSAVAYFGYSTFTTAVPQLVFAVVVFYGWVFSSLTQAVGAADKVFELMKREPKYKPPTVDPSQAQRESSNARPGIMGIEASKTQKQRTAGLRPESMDGEICLENVELHYPARPNRRVLNGLSLHIKPGQIAALVGKSGGGKTSVMSLLHHLYEPSSGKVMLDGHEVCDVAPEFLSRHISIVSQEPTLFARSIKRNIIYGLEGTDREPSDEEIEEAARLANASFIYDFPQKMDTEVGERGVQLSGGQKQRIAIARALVRKPRILLLDEATSALDGESEYLVQQAIDAMLARGRSDSSSGGMTVVVAAHRLSTVRNADVIFVIQEGQLVESGSHTQLLQENPSGAYAALIRRQLEAQEKLEAGNSSNSNADYQF